MSRHYSSRSYGGYGSSRRRTGADRFGILTFFLLLISSGFLAARLLTTGVLTQKLTLLLLAALWGGSSIWFAPLCSELLCFAMALILMRRFRRDTTA